MNKLHLKINFSVTYLHRYFLRNTQVFFNSLGHFLAVDVCYVFLYMIFENHYLTSFHCIPQIDGSYGESHKTLPCTRRKVKKKSLCNAPDFNSRDETCKTITQIFFIFILELNFFALHFTTLKKHF